MSTSEPNPFQAPMAEPSHRPRYPQTPESPTLLRSFLKWLVICAISAAPSFAVALLLTQDSVFDEIAGMVMGIMVFVLAYTLLEQRPEVQHLLSDPRKRLTAKIGYGIRIGVSIIFPVGIYLDMVVGFIAVSITTFGDGGRPDSNGGFAWHFCTTIVQGILLNLVLLTIMLMIYGLTLVFYQVPSETEESIPVASAIDPQEGSQS